MDFLELERQYKHKIYEEFCISKEYFYRPIMETIHKIKKQFKKSGIKRYKIIMHDHLNVDIHVSRKHVSSVKKLVNRSGKAGVNYQVKKLWFFQCWFEKIQVVEEK